MCLLYFTIPIIAEIHSRKVETGWKTLYLDTRVAPSNSTQSCPLCYPSPLIMPHNDTNTRHPALPVPVTWVMCKPRAQQYQITHNTGHQQHTGGLWILNTASVILVLMLFLKLVWFGISCLGTVASSPDVSPCQATDGVRTPETPASRIPGQGSGWHQRWWENECPWANTHRQRGDSSNLWENHPDVSSQTLK